MIRDIVVVLQPLISKASSLIGNMTSNLAESWMAIRTKMDSCKKVERVWPNLMDNKVYGPGLRNSLGIYWSPMTWQNVTMTPATVPFGQHYTKVKRVSDMSAKSRRKSQVQQRCRKRKAARQNLGQTKKARQAYGQHSIVSAYIACIDFINLITATLWNAASRGNFALSSKWLFFIFESGLGRVVIFYGGLSQIWPRNAPRFPNARQCSALFRDFHPCIWWSQSYDRLIMNTLW